MQGCGQGAQAQAPLRLRSSCTAPMDGGLLSVEAALALQACPILDRSVSDC